MEEVLYWEINYISCEGNTRFTHAKTPVFWTEDDVSSAMLEQGSCGDDPAEIISVYEAGDDIEDESYYDFT